MLYFKSRDHFINYCKKYFKDFTNEYYIELITLIDLALAGDKQAINFVKRFCYLLKNSNEHKDELINVALLLKEFKSGRYKEMLKEIPVFSKEEEINKAEFFLDRSFTKEFKDLINRLTFQSVQGLYIFWENKENIVYINDSTDIGDILFYTLRQKKFNAEYVSIIPMNNNVDREIIKLYYISKLKPKLNAESTNEYEPSFEISYKIPNENLIQIFDICLDDFI